MTHEDPLVDILTRRILELEEQLRVAQESRITFVSEETQQVIPNQLQNHVRCKDYDDSCPQSPCYDCDLNYVCE